MSLHEPGVGSARLQSLSCGDELAPALVQRTLHALAPSVQFPVTICVLCYGPNASLAERFLESLFRNTDPSLFLLRAGLNEVEAATHSLLSKYANQFGNIELFVEPKNIFKNPLMRRMFNERPIPSEWTIWCDDDTHFTRPDWLQRLALKIEAYPEVAMWGWIHVLWRRDQEILNWIRLATWFRGVPFRKGTDLDGKPAIEFRFAPGAFWAIRTEVLRFIDWPDPRLVQADEDFILGEALRQNSLRIENFKYGIKVNDAPRRNEGAANSFSRLGARS
jgi:GT2 family glycosyltransferase